MKSLLNKIEALYQRYDFTENHEEMLLFVIKIMTLKLLTDKTYISLDKSKERKLIQNFSLGTILSFWDTDSLSDDWGSREKHPISTVIWQDIKEFLNETDSLKEADTAVLGKIYEFCLQHGHRRQQGIFYTPESIAKYMAQTCITSGKERVMDPACGSGALLNAVYQQVSEKKPDQQTHRKLLKEQIWGIDKDPLAVTVSKLTLALKSEAYCYPEHICQGDALLNTAFDAFNATFDVVIANPPYVGHKSVTSEYMHRLRENYNGVYQNKSDLSYCFFKRGYDFLKQNGTLLFITSRYYMEAYHASGLRDFLQKFFSIQTVIDFNGLRIIEGIGVDPAIIHLVKDKPLPDHQIQVCRFHVEAKNLKTTETYLKDLTARTETYHERFTMQQNNLKKDIWRLYTPLTQQIIEKIEKHAPFTLDNIVESFQGIITGNDKVFVFDADEIEAHHFNHGLIRPWIKNKDVRAYTIQQPSKVLLYTDAIQSLENYPEEKAYLEKYQVKLGSRRECKNGVRKWYQIQWGRNPALFERKKIVFPYKATSSRFAIDTDGNYFSADIYGLVLKERLYSQINEEVLVMLLNSRLYDFYFKSFAKKLGTDLYEYYPNTLLKLRIPEIDGQNAFNFKALYDKMINLGSSIKDNPCCPEFDRWLYAYFELTREEINYIEKQIEMSKTS